jgi:hypothetical protein
MRKRVVRALIFLVIAIVGATGAASAAGAFGGGPASVSNTIDDSIGWE